MNSSFTGLLIFLLLLVSFSCKFPTRNPGKPYTQISHPAAPDYSLENNWAALPGKKDAADLSPVDSVRENQANAGTDVFFIYPTIYNSKKNWNASIDDEKLNGKIDSLPIRYQATLFNGSGKIYIPRYRQTTFGTFFTNDSISKKASLELAYTDIKAAFEYFLENYNNNRPFVIAGHSQGSYLGMLLLRDYIDGKPIQKRMVAAYIPGWPVQQKMYQQLKKCESPEETGCICSWSTFEWGFSPETLPYYKDAICVNPVSWKTNTEYASRECNAGVVLRGFNKIIDGCCDAQINDNILWTHKPDVPGKILFKSKNYHIGDYNLFWYDVRRNFAQRVKAFSEKK